MSTPFRFPDLSPKPSGPSDDTSSGPKLSDLVIAHFRDDPLLYTKSVVIEIARKKTSPEPSLYDCLLSINFIYRTCYYNGTTLTKEQFIETLKTQMVQMLYRPLQLPGKTFYDWIQGGAMSTKAIYQPNCTLKNLIDTIQHSPTPGFSDGKIDFAVLEVLAHTLNVGIMVVTVYEVEFFEEEPKEMIDVIPNPWMGSFSSFVVLLARFPRNPSEKGTFVLLGTIPERLLLEGDNYKNETKIHFPREDPFIQALLKRNDVLLQKEA